MRSGQREGEGGLGECPNYIPKRARRACVQATFLAIENKTFLGRFWSFRSSRLSESGFHLQ